MSGQPCDLCGAKWLRDEDAEMCCWDFKAGFRVIHGKVARSNQAGPATCQCSPCEEAGFKTCGKPSLRDTGFCADCQPVGDY